MHILHGSFWYRITTAGIEQHAGRGTGPGLLISLLKYDIINAQAFIIIYLNA